MGRLGFQSLWFRNRVVGFPNVNPTYGRAIALRLFSAIAHPPDFAITIKHTQDRSLLPQPAITPLHTCDRPLRLLSAIAIRLKV